MRYKTAIISLLLALGAMLALPPLQASPGHASLTPEQLKQCDSLLKQMVGTWTSENNVDGKKITIRMVVAPIVQDRYLKCDISVKDDAGKLLYESMMIIMLDKAMKKYLLYTFDNKGTVLQYFGDADPTQITSQGFIPMAGVERYSWRYKDKDTLEQMHWKPSQEVIKPDTPPDEKLVFHRVK